MKIVLKEKYKSLHPFTSEDLPNFTIITGKNGSGKSQLIELITTEDHKIIQIDENNSSIKPEIGGIRVLDFKNSLHIYGTRLEYHYDSNSKELYESYCKLKINAKKIIANFIKTNEKIEILESRDLINILTRPKDLHNALSNLQQEIIDASSELGRKEGIAEEYMKQELYKLHYSGELDIYKTLIISGKDFLNLDLTDFKNTIFPPLAINKYGFVTNSIDGIFNDYLLSRHQNEFLYFYKKQRGFETNAVSDKEFLKLYPEPWELFNDLIKGTGLPFKISSIDYLEFNPRETTRFEILHTSLGEKIDLKDLSSGEKVMMSLLFSFFNASYKSGKLQFPKILLMDEPDAHLHPEMSDLLIKLLYNDFSKKYGIKILITTHSPSTVALAPEGSIFELKNGQNSSLKRVPKDNALEILTEKLPKLSIDYRSHRQVFVESPTDLNYYQDVFNLLNEEHSFTHPLYFISLGYGQGSCDDVKKLVEDLRTAGNNSCFGIVDYDEGNKEEEYVYVHGPEELWSIENYLYIPLFLAGLFIKDKAQNVHRSLRLSPNYNEYQLGNEPEERLQEINDWIVDQILTKKPAAFKKENTIPIEFKNGKSIKIPTWYADESGHKIEDVLKLVFPALNRYLQKGEGELQRALTEFLVKSNNLIPKATIDLIHKLARP